MSLLAILIFTGTMVLSLWATMRVRQVYSKFSLLPASARSTGAETAVRILHQEGIYDVEIVKHDQALGDHYDPTHKRLVLSRETFHGTSVAARVSRHTSAATLYNTWMLMRRYNGGWPQWV
jgi:uncharacterized protein